MSIGFGTSNVCWVPEGQPLRFIDLQRWAEWRLDLQFWRVALAPGLIESLCDRAAEGIELCRGRAVESPRLEETIERAGGFLATLGESVEETPRSMSRIELPLGPVTSIWVRVSDAPLESFFQEDYAEQERDGGESVALIPVSGALALPECDEFEIPLLAERQEGFALLVPGHDPIAEYPLAVDRFPPMFDEFCGASGNSNQGKMINIGLNGRIARENPVATPLGLLSPGDGYATLYFHFETDTEHTVLSPVPAKHLGQIEESLGKQGFERVARNGRNQIWRRDDDWLHCIWNAPGLESEEVPALPPFIIAARAEGSRDSALREALLGAVLQTALGQVPGSRS